MTYKTVDIAESLLAQIQELPPQQQQQVLDYVEFLVEKYVKGNSDKPRIAGLHKGRVWISDDFNDPIPPEYWSGKEWNLHTGAAKNGTNIRYARFNLVDGITRKTFRKGEQSVSRSQEPFNIERGQCLGNANQTAKGFVAVIHNPYPYKNVEKVLK